MRLTEAITVNTQPQFLRSNTSVVSFNFTFDRVLIGLESKVPNASNYAATSEVSQSRGGLRNLHASQAPNNDAGRNPHGCWESLRSVRHRTGRGVASLLACAKARGWSLKCTAMVPP